MSTLPKLTDKDLREAGISYVKPKNSKYPVQKRLEAVTLYLACGNMRQVEAVTGVSYSNLRAWQLQDWWKEMEQEIKAARRSQTATKLNKLVDKALNLVEERLDNGDWRWNQKSNEFERIPLSALTVNKIATDLMQRSEAVEKLQQQETVIQNEASIQDTLKLLASEFANFNKKRTVDLPPVEEVDAVHAQWEEGLSEGSGSLHLEAFGGEEEGGAEQSESDHGEEGASTQG